MLIPYKGICQKYNIRPTGVLHIGAHWAEECHDYYQNGVCKTIWIEANPGCMMNLIDNLKTYPDHLIFNDCISDVDNQEVVFHISNNEGQSSSILDLGHHKIAHPEVHYISDIVCKTKRVDTLFKQNELTIENYPFVNIDLQGLELQALKGMGELLHQIKYIYVEVNDMELYKTGALYPELKQYLSTFGFTMKEKVMCGNTGWGDALFIRENL